MALRTGTRLGPYEIVSAIGAGGMGEVYRARDTKLDRDVALKVLPEAFTSDRDRLARFQREAKVLASLNHSNIAAIHGLEESGDVRALVLELVEGPTLADRIAQGPIPVDEALPIARQIAEALEAAHEAGIIHRDLKPPNIKVRPDGTVKVLDFGLAKLSEPPGSSAVAQGFSPASDFSQSPTITTPAAMTMQGVILGTAAYMSPEQARGKPVDKRADIWAFGCVLFEMLTGARAFHGTTVSDALASVLTTDPDWTALPPSTTAVMQRLLRRCLQKDPRRRLRDIADAALDIEEANHRAADVVITTTSSFSWRHRWAWLASGLLAGSALGWIPLTWRETLPEVGAPIRFEVPAPTGLTAISGSFAISPDGRSLVFAAASEGVPRLWIRRLDRVAAEPLGGTEGAAFPFWAPDSRAIGFFAEGKLKGLDLPSGAPRVLADAPDGRGGSWSSADVIIFAPGRGSLLYQIPASGGEPAPIAGIDAVGLGGHVFPDFLPDGRRFLFVVDRASNLASNLLEIYVGTLDGTEPRRLTPAESAAAYAAGYLLTVRGGMLVAQEFEPTKATLVGDEIALAVVGSDYTHRGWFSSSPAGVLAYRASKPDRRQLVWVDRTGRTLGQVGAVDDGLPINPELSPDGRWVAVDRLVSGQPGSDIWLVDVARGITSRFTYADGDESFPIWSQDASRLVFGFLQSGVSAFVDKPLTGAGPEQTLLTSPQYKDPLGFVGRGPDVQGLLYRQVDPKTGTDLWVLPLTGERKPVAVVQSPFEEPNGQFSPDGRWLAYESNESGRFEIYLQSFPEMAAKRQVSTSGGIQPRWRGDGQELFYVSPDETIMAVPVVTAGGRNLEVGVPAPLFKARIVGGGISHPILKQQYDVATDGQRFLVNTVLEEPAASSITVIVNWTQTLRGLSVPQP